MPRPAHPERFQRTLAAALVCAVLAAAVLYPAAFVFAEIARGLLGPAPAAISRRVDLGLFFESAATAALVAGLATALALPAAWGSRGLPARALVFFLIPLLLPSYLAYSGWGLLRAPGTTVGDFLLRGPDWYPVIAGKVLALGGLVLWSWPLAFILIAAAFRRLDGSVLDALRLEPGPAWRKAFTILGMARGSVLAGFGAVFLVMLGSAVPLHIAQFDTFAITIWRTLDETPYAQHWRVWAHAWPLLVVAAAASWLILKGLSRPSEAQASGPGRERRWIPLGWAAVLWCLSVAVPAVLFATSLRSGHSLATFWRVTAGAMAASALVGLGVAVVGSAMAAGVWFWQSSAADRRPRPAVAAALVAFLIAGLIPGVLVGSSLVHAYRAFPATIGVSESLLILVIGHTARFGFLAVLAGIVLAKSEPAPLRDLRLIEGGGGVWGWLVAAVPPQAGLLAGTALAMGLLSFQEIESTVQLQPPTSSGGSFAQKMLQNLHFARMEDLSAGVLVVTGAGLVGCLAILILAPKRPPYRP